jgi:tetratricopeptide (TPR) repeat protein
MHNYFHKNVFSKEPMFCGNLRPKLQSKDFLLPSYIRYRHIASYLKFFTLILFSTSLISNTYAQSSLQKISSVWRLKGPSSAPKSVRSEKVRAGSKLCGGGPTLDLILSFADQGEARAWVDFESFTQDAPCESKAYPVLNGFELRFSYKARPNENLQILSYAVEGAWLVDHWKVSESRPAAKAPVAKKKTEATEIPARATNPLVSFSDQVMDLYRDQESWQKILGQSGEAVSFESPELDRFRVAVGQLNVDYEKLPRHKRPLRPPFLSLPMLDGELIFSEETFENTTFDVSDLPKDAREKASDRERRLALEGLNYLRNLVAQKSWLKARESIEVLERGNIKHLIPREDAKWWALKGLVYRKLGEEINNAEIANRGLDFWREGLRQAAGRGGGGQAYADFMVLESLRALFEAKLYYPAAAVLAWSQRYRWAPRAEERLDYLRGEVHYRLGLMDEAHELFASFLELRKDSPLSASFDRRLVPMAYFRSGDSLMRRNRFEQAIQEYSQSFGKILTQGKISFEGAWFPEEIRYYPQVLFHRAEASLRVGNIPAALSDLRAFVNFALDHPNLSIILYRVADLMEWAQASEEKIQGAWRECLFRSGDEVGGRLCKARQAARSISKENRNEWPRFVAEVEDVVSAKNLSAFEKSFTEDIKIYIRILLTDAFLRADDPFQAYEQTQKSQGIEASSDLIAWIKEYRVSALAGFLDLRLGLKRYQDLLSLYTRAQNPPGVDVNRPEVLWPLTRAYRDMGTWKLAHETVKQGMQADQKNRPHEGRPYLPLTKDWKRLRVEIELKLFEQGVLESLAVKKSLDSLGDKNSVESLKLWAEYHRIREDTKEEEKAYAQILRKSVLSPSEHLRYISLLEKNKKNTLKNKHLETYVAPFLSEELALDKEPDWQALFFALFESRESQQKLSRAEVAINKLIQSQSLGAALAREQLLYRRGLLLNKMGRNDDARQSFESAKSLAPDSIWGRLSQNELQAREI